MLHADRGRHAGVNMRRDPPSLPPRLETCARDHSARPVDGLSQKLAAAVGDPLCWRQHNGRRLMACRKRRRSARTGRRSPAIGLGCMSLSGVYGTSDDAAGDRVDPAGDRSRRRSSRQLRHVWLGPERGTARPRAARAARQGRAGVSKFGQTQNPGGANGVDGRPEYVAAGLRGEPEAARDRHHRPLLPAPGRSRRAGRGDGRRDGAAGRAGQGALSRPVRGARPSASAARTRCTRSPRCRANSRCSTARRRPRRAR